MKKNKIKDESLEKLGEEIHNEEILFLKEELKEIEKQIKDTNYDDINKQKKLWDLREYILKEISKFLNVYIMTYTQQCKVEKPNIEK